MVGGVLLIAALMVKAFEKAAPCYCVWTLAAAGIAAVTVPLVFYRGILWAVQRMGADLPTDVGRYLLIVSALLCIMLFKTELPRSALSEWAE